MDEYLALYLINFLCFLFLVKWWNIFSQYVFIYFSALFSLYLLFGTRVSYFRWLENASHVTETYFFSFSLCFGVDDFC